MGWWSWGYHIYVISRRSQFHHGPCMQVSLALQKALEASSKKLAGELEGQTAAEMMEELKKKIFEVYNPPPPEPVEGKAPSVAYALIVSATAMGSLSLVSSAPMHPCSIFMCEFMFLASLLVTHPPRTAHQPQARRPPPQLLPQLRPQQTHPQQRRRHLPPRRAVTQLHCSTMRSRSS